MTTQVTTTIVADSVGEMMRDLRELGNAALRQVIVNMERDSVRDNIPDTTTTNALLQEIEDLKADNDMLRKSRDNYAANIEKLPETKTLYNLAHVDKVAEQARRDGYTAGYDQAKQEHEEERSTEQRMQLAARGFEQQLGYMLKHDRVMLRLDANHTPFVFMPEFASRGDRSTVVPIDPKNLDRVGIVGIHLLSQKRIFIADYYGWSVVSEDNLRYVSPSNSENK